MDHIHQTRQRSIFCIFWGFSAFLTFLVITVDRWTYMTSHGIVGFLYLSMLLSLVLFGLYLGVLGIVYYTMTQNSDAKLAAFKETMSEYGYPSFTPIIVYNDNQDKANPNDKKIHYRYQDRTHIFKPNHQTIVTLSFNPRFVLIKDTLNGYFLVYDNLKESWLLFARS